MRPAKPSLRRVAAAWLPAWPAPTISMVPVLSTEVARIRTRPWACVSWPPAPMMWPGPNISQQRCIILMYITVDNNFGKGYRDVRALADLPIGATPHDRAVGAEAPAAP